MRNKDITRGILIVCVGVMLLLHTLGILPKIPWGSIFSLWPFLVAFLLIRMILSPGVLRVVLPVLLLLGVILLASGYFGPSRPMQHQLNLKEGVTQGIIRTDSVGVLRAHIRGTHSTPILQHSSTHFVLLSEEKEDQLKLTLTGIETARFKAHRLPEFHGELSSSTEWTLDLDVPVLVGDFDLTGFPWTETQIHCNLGYLTLTLDSLSDYSRLVKVRNDVGRVVLRIPRHTNVTIVAPNFSGLNNIKNRGFVLAGNRYESRNFDSNEPYYHIRLDTSLTSISVEWI